MEKIWYPNFPKWQLYENAQKLLNKNLTSAYRIQIRYPLVYSHDLMYFYKTNVIFYIYY